MSFSTQPNEMLDMILNQTGIPLPQRIRLRAVSPRFRDILEDGLQQENSLVIRVMLQKDLRMLKRGEVTVQPNHLLFSVSNFTKEKAIDFIQRLFPSATELAINSDSLFAWRKATELFRLYAPTLTSLKVDGYLTKPESHESVFRSLGDAINSIGTLSSLYSTSGHWFGPLLLYLAPTLSRLERFTMERGIGQNQATLIAASLSSRCTHLRLDFDYNVYTFPLRDAINLTHLHLDYVKDGVLQYVLQLPQLTTLILRDSKQDHFETLLQKIRPSSQVTQITFIRITYYSPLVPPASKAFTFPSIKRLTLQLVSPAQKPFSFDPNISFKTNFNALDYLSTLASWFPNLSICSLHVPEEYRAGILAIQEGLPYTVKLLDNLVPTF